MTVNSIRFVIFTIRTLTHQFCMCAYKVHSCSQFFAFWLCRLHVIFACVSARHQLLARSNSVESFGQYALCYYRYSELAYAESQACVCKTVCIRRNVKQVFRLFTINH